MRGNYKTCFQGAQNLTAVEGNASVYQVNPVSRISGEGKAEYLRTWGPDLDPKGGGRGGKGGRARVGQVYLCVETINISCGGGGMWRGGGRACAIYIFIPKE